MMYDGYSKWLVRLYRTGTVLTVWASCLLLGTALAGWAEVPTPLSSSPFTFTSPPAGQNSNLALLNPDETRLFVTNQRSNTITVLNVASDGTLTFFGTYDTTPSIYATGMALNPAGDRLYVTTYSDTMNVHRVQADGSLPQLQAASLGTESSAGNSIVYVSIAGGDFVYVNNNEVPNTVTAFRVETDGTLTIQEVVSTAGNGNPIGLFAAPRLLAGSDDRLYAVNEGSNAIAVFTIAPSTGSLLQVPGSPFGLPPNATSSGALAISADAANLYAGTREGTIVQYHINGSNGTLSLGQVGFTGIIDDLAGMVVDPTGTLVVGVLFLEKRLAVLHTATMTPVTSSPFNTDITSPSAYPTGAILNRTGNLLFTGTANNTNTQVSGYMFSP